MNQVSEFQQGDKVSRVFLLEDGNNHLVEYYDAANGLALRAGYYSTKEVADLKANELLSAESISGEMLVGNVAVE